MKILQITNKAIHPPDGGNLAILSLAKGYVKNGHSVCILNMTTHKHFNKEDHIENEYKKQLNITGVKINSRISVFKLITNLIFSKKPYISERFESKSFKTKLVELLQTESFDFIQLESLYALPYVETVRKYFKGKVIYRSHNLEYLIWERIARETSSILKRTYFKITSKRLKQLEVALINTYDILVPITTNDAEIYQSMGNTKPVINAPFGIDIQKIKLLKEPPSLAGQPTINYIGALDWIPNQQGLMWFIKECFPTIQKSIKNIRLNVAGRNAPQWFINKLKGKNIQYIGEVDDAYNFIQNPGPMIVPLFSGSGMRVKIIEFMAFSKLVIATSMAAEGIECEHNKNILLADSSEEFANLIISSIKEKSKQVKIGDNAFYFVSKNHNFTDIAANILNYIQ